MVSRKIPLAAATLIALSCTGAGATSLASGEFSGLTITLIDLRPDDGIAPSIIFQTSDDSGSGVELRGNKYDGSANSVETHRTSALLANLSTTLPPNHPYAAGAQLSGDPLGAGRTLSAWSSVADTRWTDVNAHAFENQQFRLSPHTLMVFSGTGSLDAHADFVSDDPGDAVSGRTSSDVYLSMGISGTTSAGYFDHSVGLSSHEISGGIDHQQEGLSVSFRNAGADWATASLSEDCLAVVSADVTVVAEPATPALLLAGLAAVGGLARRRTRPCASAAPARS